MRSKGTAVAVGRDLLWGWGPVGLGAALFPFVMIGLLGPLVAGLGIAVIPVAVPLATAALVLAGARMWPTGA